MVNENSSGSMATAMDEQSGSFSVTSKGRSKDKRRHWTFILNENGSWGWQMTKPDGTQTSSKASFKKLTECTADAVRHGYVVWQGEDRRLTERAWKPVHRAGER
jgi:hypothetical protein